MNRGRAPAKRPQAFFSIAVFFSGLAQAATDDPQVSGLQEKDSRPIEEVIVTAQRRSQSQLEVPLSVAALSREELERNNIDELSGLQNVVAGLTIARPGPTVNPTIRGVGSQVAGPGLSSNVAIYVDGVYRTNPNLNNMSFGDTASVEVLKGPQGTLYGKNATGGAILVSTRGPSENFEAEVSLDYRDYDETGVTAFLGIPLSDKAGVSLAAFGKWGDGYYDNVVDGVADADMDQWGTRLKAVYWATPDLSFNITWEHVDIDDPFYLAFTNYEGASIGALFPGSIVTSEPRKYSNDYLPRWRGRKDTVFLNVEWELDWARLTSITSVDTQDVYAGYDVDGSSLPLAHVDFPTNWDTYQQTIDLASSTGGRLEWLAGMLLFKDDSDNLVTLRSPPGPLDLQLGDLLTESYAAYADVTYHVTDKLHLTAGVRYSRDKVESEARAPRGASPIKADTDFDATTPRVTVRYDLSDNSNVYFSYTEGYKSGIFNALAAGNASTVPVEPEEIEAFEIGYKAQFDRWSLQTAAFKYDYQNLQVSAFEGPVSQLVNAAEADILGAEIQMDAQLTQELGIVLALSYLDAEYKNFPDAPHFQWSPATGISIFPDDASGNPIVNSPEFDGRLGVNYVRSFTAGLMELALNYRYQTKVNFDSFGETRQGAYGALDFSVQWESVTGRWTAKGYAENLTDEDYYTAVFQQPTAFSGRYEPDLTLGVKVSYKFIQ